MALNTGLLSDFMLSVANKFIVLSFDMLNVVAPCVDIHQESYEALTLFFI
jgi:hypothetical protein